MIIQLTHQRTLELPTEAPFNLLLSIWKPSHFPTRLERHFKSKSYRSFRLDDGTPVVVRMSMLDRGRPGIRADVFKETPLSDHDAQRLERRLRHAYGLDFPINDFLDAVRTDPELTDGPISRLQGMRPSCPESLFEILVISLVLQNTTVKRSAQMLSAILDRYGEEVVADSVRLSVFADVKRVALSSEQELRDKCRLGYRAKYLQPIAEGFIEGIVSDDEVRQLPEQDAQRRLTLLKGVGPYSAHIALSHAMQNPNLISLDVWNKKIFSQFLFGHEDAPPAAILAEADARWNGFKGTAALYLVEDQYRDAPLSSIECD